MMTIKVASNDLSDLSGAAFDRLNNSPSPVSRVTTLSSGAGDAEGSSPVGEMVQHMLRNILQSTGRQSESPAPHSEEDINCLKNSNNNNNNNNDLKVVNLSKESCRRDHSEMKTNSHEAPIKMDTKKRENITRFHELTHISRVEEADMKRARVENIVSSMRTADISSSAVAVNGCKKRKLYQPQQHDRTAADLNNSTEICSDLEQDFNTGEDEKYDLKNQLLTMEQQLAEMQQKYMQLYTKNEESEMESLVSSDMDQETCSIPSPKPPLSQSPSQTYTSPHKLVKPTSPLPSFPLHPLSFMHYHHSLPHPALRNAAALYLGISQKLLLEHEVRMAKEDAMELTIPERCYHKHRSRNLNPSGEVFNPEELAVALKCEIKSSMSNLMTLIDRFVHTKKMSGKTAEATAVEQINKDLMVASQILDQKSPRTKVIDRGNGGDKNANASTKSISSHAKTHSTCNPENNINAMNLPTSRSLFPSKLNLHPSAKICSSGQLINSSSTSDISDANIPEQNEALSLVVAPKKKRHKVTDTRISARTANRTSAQDGFSNASNSPDSLDKYGNANKSSEPAATRSFHLQNSTSTLPVLLPTTVAIPNPSLRESQVFSPYTSFYGQHIPSHHLQSTSPASLAEHFSQSPPLRHFHSALLSAAQRQQQQQEHYQRANSPTDYMRSVSTTTADDVISECASSEYDGFMNTGSSLNTNCQLNAKHLRKAKMMFFYVRYPTSQLLKTFFPDIQFNKNNTAQLVKWFSNFREYYYGQIEREAQNMINEGKNLDSLNVNTDCQLYRNLNSHYNRNNQLEVPEKFCYVIEQTLREFYKAIAIERNKEQSWKKAIYKIISKLDDPVPEYFKLPNFIDQLEL